MSQLAYAGGTLGGLLANALSSHRHRTAFIDAEGRRTSYAELAQRIDQVIRTLDALGLEPGDTVAQLSGNRVEMFSVMAAAYLRGWRSLTLHTLNSADDHAHVLRDSAAKILITESYFAPRVEQLRAQCTDVRHWLSHDPADGLPDIWSLAAPHEAAPLVCHGRPDDIIRLAYTGGTTGRPKGVMLSQRAMLANTLMWLAGLPWPDQAHCLCSAPISHGAGSLIFPTLARGGCVVLQRGFDKDRWLEAVATHRIQYTFIVPTMLYALLDHPATHETDLSSLQALIYGGAPAYPARLRQALNTFGPVLVQSYGQTEAPNTILLLDQNAHAQADERRLAAAGRPFPGIDVELLDTNNAPVAPGAVGEICVRGPLVMSGYHGQPEETERALDGGWLHTGDLATRDADGLFHIVDRKKDMIISGGFNVYPKEVEDALASHPDILAASVIGVPDPKWGEAVKAIVVCRAGTHPSVEALIEHVRQRKGAICAPKSIDFVDALPLTGLGKPDRKALRQSYWVDAERAVS